MQNARRERAGHQEFSKCRTRGECEDHPGDKAHLQGIHPGFKT